MKLALYSAVIVVHLLFTGTPVEAREFMVGLSPFQKPSAAKQQIKSVIGFLVEILEPGDRAWLFDAYHQTSLGQFAVPNKSIYANPKAKLGANRQAVANLLKFAKEAREPKGRDQPSLMGAVRLPQFLRFIGENYPTTTEMDVIVLGNPLFSDPSDKPFSMAQFSIPGDGHFSHDRRDTPFGLKGQRSLLTKRRVHLGFPDESWKRDDHHGFYVQRFWALFIEQQGGVLATFTHDIGTLYQRIKTRAPVPKHSYELEKTDKLEMILLRSREVKHHTSLFERPLSTTPVTPGWETQLNNLSIAITWDDPQSDLDLYVQHGSHTKPLYYLNTETAEGKYYKDFMNSPRATNGYETVSFFQPVNVNELIVAINFFGGLAQESVTGEVRISLDGQTFARKFEIKAKKGNHGKGREETLARRKPANPQWIVIDPLSVVGLQAKG